MKLASLITLLCLGGIACAGSTSIVQDRTVLIQYTRVPSSEDGSSVLAIGAERAVVVRVLRAIAARGPVQARQYEALPGVLRSHDLGEAEDPLISVFIQVLDVPTLEDSLYVISLGAQTVGALRPENMIAALLRLSLVDRLSERARFVAVEAVLPGSRVGP